ncbi:MAG: efflux RND transporter periplasmic adaptor subunit [Thermoanaerobaculia bacterium]
MKRLSSLLPVLLSALALAAGTPEAKVFSSHLMVDQEVAVSSRITGVVETIHVERGAAVTRGQPLATLELREFDQDVEQAKAQMALARAELDRAEALTTGGVGSRADLDTKRAAYAVAVAAWEKAKAVRDYAVIRAPFAGVVTDKSARIGQKVVDVQNIPLFKITAMEPLLARIYVPEKDLVSLHRGAAVEVVPVSFPKAKTTGVIDFISPTIDAASGTVQVVIKVRRDPAQPILRPGLAVEVRFKAPAP